MLGGAASAAILTVGVAAPAFAQAQDAPVSLSGLNSASGILCGLSLPVSGVAAAASVIGASCGTSSSSSSTTGSNMIQANGPMQASSPASSSLPGLNSASGSIPALGNAAGAAPGVAPEDPEVPRRTPSPDGVLRLSCSAWMPTAPRNPTSPACSRRSPSRRPSTGY